MIYKFVSHEIPPLESLNISFPYRMHKKLEAGETLTREEKDRLFSDLHASSQRSSLRLMGWCFDFSAMLKKYWVKTKYYDIQQYYAPDKTSIRNQFGHYALRIVDVTSCRH